MSSKRRRLGIHPAALVSGGLVALLALILLPRLGQSPFWADEAWVAISLRQYSFLEMFRSEELSVATPPLFLVLSRLLPWLGGTSEAALRLLPALSALGCAALLYPLSRRLGATPGVAMLAVALWVTHPMAIRYGVELKQFTTEALVTVALLYLCRLHTRDGGDGGVPIWLLTASSVVGLLLAHGAAFVVPAVFLRLLFPPGSAGTPLAPRLRRLVPFLVLTTLTFAFVQLELVRPVVDDWVREQWFPGAAFWQAGGRGGGPRTLRQALGFLVFGLGQLAGRRIGPLKVSLAIVLWSVGLGTWLRRRRSGPGIELGVPVALTWLASILRQYPFGGHRATLFLLPLAAIVLAQGLHVLVATVSRSRRIAAFAAWAAMLGLCALLLARASKLPRDSRMHLDEVVDDLRGDLRADDIVAYQPAAEFPLRYYLGHRLEQETVRLGSWSSSFEDVEPQLDGLMRRGRRDGRRLWLIFANEAWNPQPAEIAARVAERCAIRRSIEHGVASARLVDCTRRQRGRRRPSKPGS